MGSPWNVTEGPWSKSEGPWSKSSGPWSAGSAPWDEGDQHCWDRIGGDNNPWIDPHGPWEEIHTDNSWILKAPRLSTCQKILYDLVSFKGSLYGGTWWNNDDCGGSDKDGSLQKWNGVNAWTPVATDFTDWDPSFGNVSIRGLAVWRGHIYGIQGKTWYSVLLQWDGNNSWLIADKIVDFYVDFRVLKNIDDVPYIGARYWTGGKSYPSLFAVTAAEDVIFKALYDGYSGSMSPYPTDIVEHNESLYISVYYVGLLRWNEAAGTLVLVNSDFTNLTDLYVFDGNLFCMWNRKLYRLLSNNQWDLVATSAIALGRLIGYGGSTYLLGLGAVGGPSLARWSGAGFTSVVPNDGTNQMRVGCVHDGKLFASGKVGGDSGVLRQWGTEYSDKFDWEKTRGPWDEDVSASGPWTPGADHPCDPTDPNECW